MVEEQKQEERRKTYLGVEEASDSKGDNAKEYEDHREAISGIVSEKEKEMKQTEEAHPENKTTTVEEKPERRELFLPFLSLFFLGALLYLEVVFHLAHYGLPEGDFLYSCLFLPAAAALAGILSSFGGRRLRKAVSFILLSLACLLYMAQQVYCFVFKTYMTLFSLTTGTGQVMEFWREILQAVGANLHWIVLYLLPLGALGLFWHWWGKKKAGVNRAWMWRGILFGVMLVFHIGTVLGLPLLGTEYYTPYDLYHYTPAIDISVRKLGLLTTFRLDAKRLLFGIEEPESVDDYGDFTDEDDSGDLLDGSETDVVEDGQDGNSGDNGAMSEGSIAEGDNDREGVLDGGSQTDGSQSGDTPNNDTQDGNMQDGGSPGVENSDGGNADSTGDSENESDKAPVGGDNGTGGNENFGETGANILPIDFDGLIESAPNKTVADMHQYFKKADVTNKNSYTGMFKGYNLILITAEGFSPYAVQEEVTPTLCKLSKEGFVFTNFYTPLWGVSTSDGEYVACTGLIPKSGVWSFYRSGSNDMPFGFGNQFRRLGYQCRAYHNHTFDYYNRDISHPNMGYDYKGVGNGLEMTKTWPESDLEMMELTVPEYIGGEPFHTYYMTVSGHMNYSFFGNTMANKNRDVVKNLPYSETARAYVACNVELDRALEKLIGDLTEAGVMDRTVIALSADHYPYGLEKEVLDELAGHEVEENFEIYRNHFFLWTPSIKEPIIVDKAAGSMDIAPTLCNLFGLDYDSRLYMGKDILSEESDGLVIFSNRSFISDKVMYNAVTGKTTQLTGEKLPKDYIKKMNQKINQKFQYSAKILEQDYFKYFEDLWEK